MTVVFQRPYEFVPPHRGDGWPSFIQRFRLIDWHLRRNEGVVSYECRHAARFRESLDAGDGIVLAPNHCRYADPIVLGWLAREVGTHLYAMASWHLFNVSRFQSFALQKMGGFSIYREGPDRQSLETAIGILETAERPLILFPEGTTNRTNDLLKPLLEGVTFVARSAARRRQKKRGGRVVIHPIGLKYLCGTDFSGWAKQQLGEIESRIGWRPSVELTVMQRTVRLAEAMLALKEVEYLGRSQSGDLRHRRDHLMRHLLGETERKLRIEWDGVREIRERVRRIRTQAASLYFDHGGGRWDRLELENAVAAADLAQHLLSFPDCYLEPGKVTDTRIVETVQRMQESVFGKASETMPLHAVIEVDEAIEVPPDRPPRDAADPLLEQLRKRLESMVQRLAGEATPVET